MSKDREVIPVGGPSCTPQRFVAEVLGARHRLYNRACYGPFDLVLPDTHEWLYLMDSDFPIDSGVLTTVRQKCRFIDGISHVIMRPEATQVYLEDSDA